MKFKYSVLLAAILGVQSVHADQVQNPFPQPGTAASTASVNSQAQPSTGAQPQPAPQRLPQLPPLPKPLTPRESARQDIAPLSPADIRYLHKLLDKTKRAQAEYPGTPPKPVSGSITLDLSPGATPPIIRLAPGSGATLNFIDVTGAPWPIIKAVNFNTNDFKIDDPIPDGNAITASSEASYGFGNIAVFLKNSTTPITVTLANGQNEVDYRVDLRIPKRGPNAAAQVVTGDTTPQYNPVLLTALDGIPPQGAKQLHLEGANATAWEIGGRLVLRGRMEIISPAEISSVASGDGMHVFELPMSPVVLATVDGSVKRIVIGDE